MKSSFFLRGDWFELFKIYSSKDLTQPKSSQTMKLKAHDLIKVVRQLRQIKSTKKPLKTLKLQQKKSETWRKKKSSLQKDHSRDYSTFPPTQKNLSWLIFRFFFQKPLKTTYFLWIQKILKSFLCQYFESH